MDKKNTKAQQVTDWHRKFNSILLFNNIGIKLNVCIFVSNKPNDEYTRLKI